MLSQALGTLSSVFVFPRLKNSWTFASEAADTVSLRPRSPTGPTDGLLPDLPPEAVRSYLQYRYPLQLSVDYYIFDLQNAVKKPEDWGDIGTLFASASARGGQGQPSRIEREYTNVFRIIGLSMPPDVADEMRGAQYDFERAMSQISRATAGIRRDLPVELDPGAVQLAVTGWDQGRQALNAFLTSLNEVTGLNEMKLIPPAGGTQYQEYGRSVAQYNNLVKKTKLCQNRGGPTLSVAWGALMVSGTLQDSCGIPDLDDYFYQ
jgi:hypothetical protein